MSGEAQIPRSALASPFTLLMQITASEPRDVLQLERTALSFIKFSCTLFFGALAIMLDFRFESGDRGDKPQAGELVYSTVTSFALLALSLAILLVCAVNYMITVRRYASHKIETYNFNNKITVVCMSTVMTVLVGICIALVVQGYTMEKE